MAQPTKPGNAERGWNDPPMFLHTPGVASPPPPTGNTPGKRTLLNKRVAHPGLYGGAAQPTATLGQAPPMAPPTTLPPANQGQTPATGDGAAPPSVILLPPTSTIDLPKYTAPIIVPSMSPTEKQDISIVGSPVATNPVTNMPVNVDTDKELSMPNFDNDQQLYHYVVTRLHKTLRDCNAALQEKDADDCGRRLGTLAAMWEQGELSYPVKSAMARLATALHRRKCDLAQEIHLALMFDHVAEVSQWMVGVKRLIGAARGLDPPICPTDSTADDLHKFEQELIDKSQEKPQENENENTKQVEEMQNTENANPAEESTHAENMDKDSNAATPQTNTPSDNASGREESPATLPVNTEQVMVVTPLKVEEDKADENSENCDKAMDVN